jgi:hypothetical protein
MGVKVGRVVIYRVGIFSFALQTLAICALVVCGGTQLVQAGQQAATVRHISVTGEDQGLDVEITATKPITPHIQTVTDPDRLVVDLPEARPGAGLQKIPINRGKLKDVRVGLLSANPPTTRVVLDLMAPTEYRVSALANTIVVKLGNESGPKAVSIAPTANPLPDATPAETTSALPTPPPTEPSEPSPLRWIMPILVMTAVMAMLVIAIVVHLQNKQGRRGL